MLKGLKNWLESCVVIEKGQEKVYTKVIGTEIWTTEDSELIHSHDHGEFNTDFRRTPGGKYFSIQIWCGSFFIEPLSRDRAVREAIKLVKGDPKQAAEIAKKFGVSLTRA